VDAAPTAQPRQPIRLTLLGPIKGKAPCNPKNSEQRFMDTPDIVLNDGNVIPQIGLGVWTLNADETVHSLENAIAAGYRQSSLVPTGIAAKKRFVTRAMTYSGMGFGASEIASLPGSSLSSSAFAWCQRSSALPSG
jgi:2,5-diketo-D-gluconate reductase A